MTKLGSVVHALLLLAATAALAACGRTPLLTSGSTGTGGSTTTGCQSNADCPSGETCDLTTHMCVPVIGGCTSDADCASPTPHCRLDTHTCVECTTNAQCPSGEECSNFECVGFCGDGSACSNGLTCCTPLCVDTTSDPSNCGGCGDACGPFANAVAACHSSGCAIAGCTPGFANCDGLVADGCEVDTGNDPKNCGSCGNVCASGESCSGGVCVGPCGANDTCPAGQSCCNGAKCVVLSSDNQNCGACNVVCGAVPNGTSDCKASSCHIASCTAGFADCDGLEPDGCEVNTTTDPNNCGTCGNACSATESCIQGVCEPNNVTCQQNGCPSGLTCCGTACVDINSDLKNCGGCGDTCPAGSTSCMSGACCTSNTCEMQVCPGTEILCNNTCVDPTSDPNNCGGCDIVCPAGGMCVGSTCIVSTGCDGGPACVTGQTCCAEGCTDTSSDPDNCGICGLVCPPQSSCEMGTCMLGCNGGPMCAPNQQCCTSGCSDPTTDPDNCGGCNIVCGAGQICDNGSCVATCNGGPACTGNEQCCGAGCTNTLTDPLNCGKCGIICASGDTCTNGICQAPPMCNGGPACSAGETCCTTGCASLQTDPNNCGTCGLKCAATETCVGGSCLGSEGALNPTANPTYLPPGPHHYTSVNIPAGFTVYVAGGGAQSGTLDITSDGPIVIAGTIDLSGGPGTEDAISSGSTQLGQAGAGGFTGEPYASGAPSATCAFVAGNPGQLGFGVQGSAGTCPIISATACTSMNDPNALLWTSPVAQYGGGAGVFTGFRAYGSGGGGPAGGAPGALCAPYTVMGGEADCTGVSGGGGAVDGNGGNAGIAAYNGLAGMTGLTQCAGLDPGISAACVGGGGGGSIGAAAAQDLAVATTFQTGSGGGGGSGDYLNRPVFGGTSGGGGGGGALRLSTTTTITITGKLLANGGDGAGAGIGSGSPNCDPQPGAAGGGGSGGVIYLRAPVVTVGSGATVSAHGGAGGPGSEFATGGAGGAGGLGRIRVSATAASCTLGGSWNPPLASGCAPANKSGATFVGTYPN